MTDATQKRAGARTRKTKVATLTKTERAGRAEDFGVSEGLGSGSDGEATPEDLERQAQNQARLQAEQDEIDRQAALQETFAQMTPEELLQRELDLMAAAGTTDGGDPDAAKLRAALVEDPYVREAADIRVRLAELEKNEPALQGVLDDLEANRDATEAKEQERAASPLAVTLEVVECEFATTHYPDVASRQTIPTYKFGEQPCIYGKEHPDQDCRTCVHHRIAKYGHGAPPDQRRYFHHGWVIPIVSDEQAEQLALYMRASGLMNLRNIDMEIAYVRRLLAENERQRKELIAVQQRRAQGAR